jgi:uncharacterized protein (TIGR03066 family)
MKLLQLLLTAGLLVGLASVCRAEEKKADKDKTNKEKIVGTWVLEKPDKPKGGLPPGATIEFTKDGKLKLSAKQDGKEISVEGTYSVDGDKLKTTGQGPDGKEQTDTDTITKLTDKELVIKDSKSGEELTFKKK